MSVKVWSLERCVRCNTRPAKQGVQGLPTCDNCATLQAAEQESPRHCLACEAVMEKQLVRQVVIDKCTSCGGVWLDSGELELVRKVSKATKQNDEFGLGFLAGISLG